MFGSMFRDFVGLRINPSLVNNDVRQHVPPFFRCADASLFPDDLIVDYYMDAVHPPFFKAVYCLPAWAGVDPTVTSRWLPMILLLATVGFMGLTAYRVGGPAAAWATMALILGSSVFPERMAGGLHRGFAFPILALAAFLLATGRVRVLAVVVVVSAGLYPPVAFVTGVALAFVLLLPAEGLLEEVADWSFRNRILGLAGVLVASLLVMSPLLIMGSSWGARLTPGWSGIYEEVGTGGRYSEEDRFGSWQSVLDLDEGLVRTVRGSSPPWIDAVGGGALTALLVSFSAWLLLMRQDKPARRVTILPLAAIVCVAASVVFAPYVYIPQRFIAYPLPLFAMVVMGTAFPWLISRLAQRTGRSAGIVAAVVLVLVVGGRGLGGAGLDEDTTRQAELLSFVGTLPVDTLVAGWPGGAIESVPLVSRRSALLTMETHQVLHERYLVEMRRRMRALIDALYSPDETALSRFHEETGVDALIVEPRLVYESPVYFKPFDAWAREAVDSLGDRKPGLMHAGDRIMFRSDDVFVLDLRPSVE